MHPTTILTIVVVLTLAMTAGMLVGTAASCAPLAALDQQLFRSSTTQPAVAIDPLTPGAPAGVTTIEALSALLAASGFGGLAAWLRAVRGQARNGLTTVNADLTAATLALNTRLDIIDSELRVMRLGSKLTAEN